jgi:transcriptional regulator with XRE-family HTH domain
MVYGYSARLIDINKKADRKLIGVRLGRACIRNDFPVSKVAYRLGVSRQTVYNWFYGDTSPQESFIPAVEKLIESLS